MDDNVLTRIGDALGAVAQADLHLHRTGRRRLQALVDAGELKRYPHGIVALPGTDRRILIARLHRGLITCEHAAAFGWKTSRLSPSPAASPISCAAQKSGRLWSPPTPPCIGAERLANRYPHICAVLAVFLAGIA